MAAPARVRGAADAAAPRRTADSAFEASAFESALGAQGSTRWLGWRRRVLVFAALLGCLCVFALARWLAGAPHIDATWAVGPQGQLLLQRSPVPLLAPLAGHALTGIASGSPSGSPSRSPSGSESSSAAPFEVDSLLLQRALRWQVRDELRQSEAAQRAALADMLAQAWARGPLQLVFDDGSVAPVPVSVRGWTGLGTLFWPLVALALMLYLFSVVLLLARPRLRHGLYAVMCLGQAANLVLIALETAPGLVAWPADVPGSMTGRVAIDLCIAAAIVHAFALHPRRLPHARRIAALAWAVVPAWLLLNSIDAALPRWWCAQAACLGLGAAALAVSRRSHRLEPNPYALVMRRMALAALSTLALATLVVAVAAHEPAGSAAVATVASVVWYLFFTSLLLLTPFLARSRQLLREFALLAGISTVATSLDLLFVAVFSLGPFTSLAIAVFVALGVYAGARQWLVNQFIGRSRVTTERTFEHLYRAAREVQARPSRYAQQLAGLLRELFDPLEVHRVERVPVRTRVLGGGSSLVVPMRNAGEDGEPATALLLRFAQRGQRLFTLDDARLADRVLDALRRAVAYDRAVEHGRTEERQRIAQDLHDDIGARLLTLMYQAQSPEMEDYIRHTLLDLKTLTRGLAASEHRLTHAAAEWKADLTQRLTAAHVALGWSFSHDQDLRLSVVQWSALTRVLRELVSNALYHGHATRIEVSLVLHDARMELQVADDGRGRDPAAWSHGLGLGGVRKRVKLLGGEVRWNENLPRGIVCSVRLPGFGGRDPATTP